MVVIITFFLYILPNIILGNNVFTKYYMAKKAKGGYGTITGENGNTFSSTNQPSVELKKAGHRKRRLLKDLSKMLLSGSSLKQYQEQAKELLGVELDKDEISVEIAMTLVQIQKALEEGDTRAYDSAMDRLVGKAKQVVDMTTKGNEIKSIEPITWVKGSSADVTDNAKD